MLVSGVKKWHDLGAVVRFSTLRAGEIGVDFRGWDGYF